MKSWTPFTGGRARGRIAAVAVAALALGVAACGDDDDDAATTGTAASTAESVPTATASDTAATAAEAETTTVATDGTDTTAAETDGSEPASTGGGEPADLDANGDGEVRIGIAAAGPRDDGAYYQAVVDAAEEFSTANGFGEVIVVDNIQSADAATELANLAQQPVDIIIVGASEIAEPMPDLAEQYGDTFWYCNCGAGFPESEFYLQSQDEGAKIAYTAGVATGILLRDSGGDAVTMIGCCDLGFEIQHYRSYELGLQSVDPALTFTYVPSGDFPFDFDNVQNASAAYENAVAEGADAIYPYLGGAHEPIVQLANAGGQIVLSAGASDVCEREGELSWDIAVRFDGGDYVREIFPRILDGSAAEGDIIVYSPGEEPDVAGAVICSATPEQQAEMDAAYELMASGELDATFGEIAAEAFGATEEHPTADTVGAGPDGPAPTGRAAVRLDNITKRYGSVMACDDVELVLERGRVHGVLGENGAGKSTLMKIMIGLVGPDAGSISIDGEQVRLRDPLDAARHGIGMVHQHFSLVEPLRVWENVALGEAGRLAPAEVRARITEISERYGLDVDPDAVVGSLPVGMRQRVEIIKCLRRDPSILIFDEPTSVLTPAESAQLFETLRHVVVAEGRAVALVSHKLDEILRATDEVTIMRQGRVVDHVETASVDAASLARAMVGRSVSLRAERVALGVLDADLEGTEVPDTEPDRGSEVLALRGVTVRDRHGVTVLDHLDLAVRAGEIVGVAGVEGNGQRPLADVLSSLTDVDDGSVHVAGRAVSTGRAGAMARAGIGVIPEDRHDSGVVLEMSVAENLSLVDLGRVARAGLIDQRALRQRATDLIEEFEISCSGPDAPLFSLSGGNQQRVVLARELSCAPKVLVAAQPTRGLDVGAIEYMTGRIRQAAVDGVGVLLISSELEEILDLAHRIVVLSGGRIIGEMDRRDADLDRIGLLLGGQAA